MRGISQTLLAFLAGTIGGASILAFGIFLLARPRGWVSLGFAPFVSLLVDAGLSLLFFVQHSGMVRRGFRKISARFAPTGGTSAVYAIASGVALLLVVIFWQSTDRVLFSAEGPARWILRLASLAAIVGIFAGSSSLGAFDPFGVTPLIARMRGKTPRAPRFVVRGLYRWVRHPLYLFCLVIIWAHPVLTSDRLLLDVLWTAWIVIGTILEERDLAREFGTDYQQYQRRVPMLLPRPPRNTE